MNTNTAREQSGEHTVLLLGGTGRTGGRVLKQLLDRGIHVRAIVRSAERLPEGVTGHPGLLHTVALGVAHQQSAQSGNDSGCTAVERNSWPQGSAVGLPKAT